MTCRILEENLTVELQMSKVDREINSMHQSQSTLSPLFQALPVSREQLHISLHTRKKKQFINSNCYQYKEYLRYKDWIPSYIYTVYCFPFLGVKNTNTKRHLNILQFPTKHLVRDILLIILQKIYDNYPNMSNIKLFYMQNKRKERREDLMRRKHKYLHFQYLIQSVLIFLSDVRASFILCTWLFSFPTPFIGRDYQCVFLGMLVREVDHKFVDLLLNSVLFHRSICLF